MFFLRNVSKKMDLRMDIFHMHRAILLFLVLDRTMKKPVTNTKKT